MKKEDRFSVSHNSSPPASDTIRNWNRDALIILWIFLAGLLLRISFLIQLQDSPFFSHPLLDSTFFDLRAQEILDGRLFSDDYLFNPLYPYFLAGIYRLFGHSLYTPRLIQAILGALSCVLVVLIGRQTFGRIVGMIAGAFLAVYIPVIYFDGILMTESLIIFLTLGSIYSLLAAESGNRFWMFGIAGILWGLVVMGRPNYLLFALIMPVWFLRSRTGIRSALLHYSLFWLGILIVISPTTIYFKMTHGEWILVAPHGGINFYIGNHADATGTYMSIPGISDEPSRQVKDSMILAMAETGKTLSSGEVSRYWIDKSRSFIRERPIDFIRLVLKKIALYWNREEIPSEYSLSFDQRFHSVLRWPLLDFGWIGPLGLLGIALAWKSGHRVMLLHLIIVAMMVSVVTFFVHARYRLPVVPFVALFAAFALQWICQQVSRKSLKSVIGAAVMLLGTTLFCHMNLYQQNPLPGYYNLAKAYYQQGDREKSAEQLQIILATSENAKTRDFLGRILMEMGRYPEALEQLERAHVLDPAAYSTALNLGLLTYQMQDAGTAIGWFDTAIRIDPARYEPYYNAGLILAQNGDDRRAALYFQEALKRNVPAQTAKEIARLLSMGQPETGNPAPIPLFMRPDPERKE